MKLTQREKDLGYCEEARTYCSMAEEAYKQGKADAIEEVMKMAKSDIVFENIAEEKRFMQKCKQMQKGEEYGKESFN